MDYSAEYVSLTISAPTSDVRLPSAVLRILGKWLKCTPGEVTTCLVNEPVRLRKVKVNEDLLKLVEILTRRGVRVKARRLDGRPASVGGDYSDADSTEDTDATIEPDYTETIKTDWKKGDVIEGLYEVHGSDAGGMGHVYFVFHRVWKMMLAIKTPQSHVVQNEARLSRFLREAEYWVDLGLHPNIATCYYARIIEGLPRLFIEYVDGGSLDDLVESNESPALSDILDLMIQFCYGMIHAERKGMIHRDIKPANCLLSKDGTLKITDFGLVKRAGKRRRHGVGDAIPDAWAEDTTSKATLEEGVVGSPWYMAPERFDQSNREDIRSDIYSFGVMLYELIVKERPFRFPDGFSIRDLVRCHLREKPIDPLTVRPDLPESLARVILTCLKKRPDNRYPGFSEVTDALEQVYREISPTGRMRPRPNVLGLKADSLNNQAVSLLDLGRRDEAMQLLSDAHSTNTDHIHAVYNLHTLLWSNGEASDEEVINRMESLRVGERDAADYKHLMGLISLQRGFADEGVRLLKEACTESEHLRQRWVAHAGDPEAFVNSLEIESIREGTPLAGHVKRVVASAVSPNSRLAFTAGQDKSIRTWDLSTGRCLKNRRAMTSVPVAGAFSPEGALAAVAYGNAFKTVDIWETETGRLHRRFQGPAIHGTAFSPDGRHVVAFGDEGFIKLWDLESEKSLENQDNPRTITTTAFLPDSRSIAVGREDGTIAVWRPGARRWTFGILAHEGPVTCLGSSHDGSILISGGADEAVRLWNPETGMEIAALTGHRRKVVGVRTTPDDAYVISGSADGVIKYWDLISGRCCSTIRVASEEPAGFSLSPDGRRLLCAGERGRLRLWTIDTGWFSCDFLEPALCRPLTFQELSELHARFREGIDEFRRAWGQGHHREAQQSFDRVRNMPGFAWSQEAILIRNLLQETHNGRGLKSSCFIRSFHGHQASVGCLDASADSLMLLTGSVDGTAALWDVVTGRLLRRFRHEAPVGAVFFHPRMRGVIAWTVEGILRIWAMNGKLLKEIEGIELPLALTPDGASVLGLAPTREAVLLDIESGEIRSVGAALPEGRFLCFSHNLQSVYSIRRDVRLQRWDVETGRSKGAFRDLGIRITALKPTVDDDRVIAGMESGELMVYMVGSGVNVSVLRGHEASIRTVDASPREYAWATGSDDCAVRVWDPRRSDGLSVLEGHASPVTSVKFFPNGSMLASGGRDGSVRLWGLDWELGEPAL